MAAETITHIIIALVVPVMETFKAKQSDLGPDRLNTFLLPNRTPCAGIRRFGTSARPSPRHTCVGVQEAYNTRRSSKRPPTGSSARCMRYTGGIFSSEGLESCFVGAQGWCSTGPACLMPETCSGQHQRLRVASRPVLGLRIHPMSLSWRVLSLQRPFWCKSEWRMVCGKFSSCLD